MERRWNLRKTQEKVETLSFLLQVADLDENVEGGGIYALTDAPAEAPTLFVFTDDCVEDYLRLGSMDSRIPPSASLLLM